MELTRYNLAWRHDNGVDKAKAKMIIEKELADLGISKSSRAFKLVFEQAIEAADVMTAGQLKKYVEDYVESLPSSAF